MKSFDKFILWLFSLIILSFVIFGALLIFDIFGARAILENAPKTYYVLISTDKDTIILSIVVLIVLSILSIKGLLFQSKTKKNKTDGILLENNNGKLLISRETLENLVRDISRGIQGTETVSSKIYLDENNDIVVDINAVVYQDAIIKEVTKRMQEEIKIAIKQASDLEVSEVNVNIDKISNKTSPEMKQREEKEEIPTEKEEIVEEEAKDETKKTKAMKENKDIKPTKDTKETKLQKEDKKTDSKEKTSEKKETKTSKVKK